MLLIIIIIALVAGFVIPTYNSLTKAKNRIELAEIELRKYEKSGTA